MNDACGSHTYLYFPFFSVSVHVVEPLNVTDVFLFTPGPVRWKLWIFDLSAILKTYFPALSLLTFLPPWVSEIVNPGPTVPVSVGVLASAAGTASSAAVAAIATSFI